MLYIRNLCLYVGAAAELLGSENRSVWVCVCVYLFVHDGQRSCHIRILLLTFTIKNGTAIFSREHTGFFKVNILLLGDV